MAMQNHLVPGEPAGLTRRLGALLSDSLVVLGLLLLGSLPFVPLLQHLDAKAMVPSEVGWPWCVVYWIWLLAIWTGFIGYFWTHGGQTVGMKAWRLRVQADNGSGLGWRTALQRFSYGLLPWLPSLLVLAYADRYHSLTLQQVGKGLILLGVAAVLYLFKDPQKRTWHDLMSKSRVIILPKL